MSKSERSLQFVGGELNVNVGISLWKAQPFLSHKQSEVVDGKSCTTFIFISSVDEAETHKDKSDFQQKKTSVDKLEIITANESANKYKSSSNLVKVCLKAQCV